MMRIAIICLFIVGLLICPLRCGKSCSANAGEGARAVSDCCSDCRHSTSDRSNDEQLPPERDCDCVSCYCKGAIVSTDFKWTDGNGFVAIGLEISLESFFNQGSVLSLSDFGDSPPLYGRSMRIAIQSWQI